MIIILEEQGAVKFTLNFSSSHFKGQHLTPGGQHLFSHSSRYPTLSFLLWGRSTVGLKQLWFYPEAQFP